MTRPAVAELVKSAKAVASLWNLTLMTTGAPAARGRTADVLHEAITQLSAAAALVEASEKDQP